MTRIGCFGMVQNPLFSSFLLSDKSITGPNSQRIVYG